MADEYIRAEESDSGVKFWLGWLGRVCKSACAVLRERLLWVIVATSLVFFVVGCLYPNDPVILESVQNQLGEQNRDYSVFISDTGKFEYVSLLLPALLLIVGALRRKRELCKAAVVILLAGIVAGLAVNVLRPTFGRARPDSGEPNGFYGPSMQHRFNSFPSGHSTTAWATAISTSMTMPVLAPPMVLWATGVSVSRMHLNKHYPGDVFAGAALGSGIAWMLVRGMRREASRIRRRDTRKRGD
jgi:membrane-associated phospholipid phosphatase